MIQSLTRREDLTELFAGYGLVVVRVKLHDYVDVDIPVLTRMHTKRLPAYKTLGFEVQKR